MKRKVKLIAELETEEKNMVFKMIDTFLTKKKFKDFFNTQFDRFRSTIKKM